MLCNSEFSKLLLYLTLFNIWLALPLNLLILKSKRVRVRKIYFDNERHDIEETNTETFMCRSMSATNAYTKL